MGLAAFGVPVSGRLAEAPVAEVPVTRDHPERDYPRLRQIDHDLIGVPRPQADALLDASHDTRALEMGLRTARPAAG